MGGGGGGVRKGPNEYMSGEQLVHDQLWVTDLILNTKFNCLILHDIQPTSPYEDEFGVYFLAPTKNRMALFLTL